jgi:hypothetical protein
MFRLVVMLSLAAVTLGLSAPAASAAPAQTHIDADLTALWTTVLETPNPQPFSTPPGGSPCWVLPHGTVAPFGPGANGGSCTVKPGTKILVAAWSNECSTFEGNGSTEAELRACAEAGNATTASVTVDGHSVPVKEVETRLMNIVLPADNIFSLPPGPDLSGLSVGAGWVTHVDPLTPGMHTIAGSAEVPPPIGTVFFTTTINVTSS